MSEYGSSSDEPEKNATLRGSELCRVPFVFDEEISGLTSEMKMKKSESKLFDKVNEHVCFFNPVFFLITTQLLV